MADEKGGRIVSGVSLTFGPGKRLRMRREMRRMTPKDISRLLSALKNGRYPINIGNINDRFVETEDGIGARQCKSSMSN